MEVRQLNTLIRAAQFQSFSKAAESLGYSQSAVTVQIKTLEEELGVRLFDRMNKRVLLTVDGQRFLEYANSILDTIQSARQALNENAELGGSLHIGTLESLCFFRLPGLIRQFRLEHPRVGLRVTTGSPEELIEKMEQGKWILSAFWTSPATPITGTSATKCRKKWCLWQRRTSTSAIPALTGWPNCWTNRSS